MKNSIIKINAVFMNSEKPYDPCVTKSENFLFSSAQW